MILTLVRFDLHLQKEMDNKVIVINFQTRSSLPYSAQILFYSYF